ncbi:hypothetical protein B0H14DRAFT_2555226 [Mycena olivaceomarginata]|nr:hypothetical protein B0H14DRAFT_2555226 [Mycena olivaceomarginata]
MDVDGQVLSGGSFSCLFQDPSASVCASASNAVHGHVPEPPTSSRNTLRDIFTAHYCTHSLNLLQCRRALIHHLVSGASFEHKLDAHPNSKIDRSTCAVIAEEFESTSSITAPVLDIILTAEHKKISTEHLCHVAAALDIIPWGSHNLRFKTHLWPVLLLIAALHRIEVLSKSGVETIRRLITTHTHSLGPLYAIFALASTNLYCADVGDEWEADNIDPDIQVHILTAIYGSKTCQNVMRRILNTLNIQNDPVDSVKTYRKQMCSYILTLRKGKRAECEQQTKAADLAQYTPKLEKIHESWPQLIPQSLKDRIIKFFREMTSSEAFTSFMCALCAEAVPLRSHCSLSTKDFNLEILKRPDMAENEALLLDHYKWLHPDCIPPPMPA